MRDALDDDGEVWIASGAVTSFPNASCRGAGNAELHRRSCSGRSSRKTTAAVVAAGGGLGEVWRAEPGRGKRPAKGSGESGWESETGCGDTAAAPEL